MDDITLAVRFALTGDVPTALFPPSTLDLTLTRSSAGSPGLVLHFKPRTFERSDGRGPSMSVTASSALAIPDHVPAPEEGDTVTLGLHGLDGARLRVCGRPGTSGEGARVERALLDMLGLSGWADRVDRSADVWTAGGGEADGVSHGDTGAGGIMLFVPYDGSMVWTSGGQQDASRVGQLNGRLAISVSATISGTTTGTGG